MSKVGTATKEEIHEADKTLSKIFYSDKLIASGFTKLWDAVKDKGIPYRVVRGWYENQEIVQIFKPLKSPQTTFHIRTNSPLRVIFMDTMSIDDYYIINTIDLFTKFASSTVFRKPVDSNDAVKALKEFLTSANAKLDDIGEIRCDGGPEYQGEFKKYVGDKRIVSLPYAKQEMSPVERFNGTLRRMLEKLKVYSGKPISWAYKYVPKAVTAYNDTTHSAIGIPPREAMRNEEAQQNIRQIYRASSKKDDSVKKGDTVRIVTRDTKNAFDTKIRPQWSEETYTVTDVRGNRVTLNDGNVLKGHEVRVIDPTLLMKKKISIHYAEPQERSRDERKIEKRVEREQRKLSENITTAFGQPIAEKRQRKPNSRYAE